MNTAKPNIRIHIRVENGVGEGINTSYPAQEALINFELMQNKMIEDMVELAHMSRQDVEKNIRKVKPTKKIYKI